MSRCSHLESFISGLGIGVHHEELLLKAQEYLRLMDIKVQDLKKAENARNSIATEFACKYLHIDVPRDKLVELAGISSKDYKTALQKCAVRMDLKFKNRNTIEVYKIKYSSDDTAAYAYSLLETYKQQDAISKPFEQIPDYETPLYHGAAFVVAAKVNKLQAVPKKDKFFDLLDLPSKQLFQKVCTAMEVNRWTLDFRQLSDSDLCFFYLS
jgi:hypothetical protein